MLRLLDVPRMIALGTPLPVTLPTAIVGAWTYWRSRVVNVRAALWTAAGGVPFVVVGSYLTAHVPGRLLMLLTGVFVVGVAVRLLARPLASEAASPSSPAQSSHPSWLFVLVGMGVGFLSGLLANGGGFLLVPAYLLLFRMETKEAAATSLVAVALMALPGTVVHWQLGHINARMTALLALGSTPATFVGARVGIALNPASHVCYLASSCLFSASFSPCVPSTGWLSMDGGRSESDHWRQTSPTGFCVYCGDYRMRITRRSA
jgi:uncharacterized membrane protein YfcA